MSTKYVYTFGDGKAEGKADMKNLLGGKVEKLIVSWDVFQWKDDLTIIVGPDHT